MPGVIHENRRNAELLHDRTARRVDARSIGDVGIEATHARLSDPIAQLGEGRRRTSARAIEGGDGGASLNQRVGPDRTETSERARHDGDFSGQGKTARHERASSGVLFRS